MEKKEDHCCSSHGGGCSSTQTMSEMDFERGIWQAALDGDVARTKDLLSRRPDAHADRDASGYTALHYAARTGHAPVALLLLRRGADANATTPAGGATPLHRAAYKGRTECVKLLLDLGADPSLTDSDGMTALHKAAEGNSRECFKEIAKRNPKLEEVVDKKGKSAGEYLLL